MTKRKKIIPAAYDDQATASPEVPALVLRGKDDWNERAKQDPLHWTVNLYPPGEWNFEHYMATGDATLDDALDPLVAQGVLKPYPLGTVCEIGAGAGRISQALSKRADKVIGMDVSGEMLKAARKNMKELGITNVTFREGNGYNLDVFKDGEADFVCSVICFQHIPSRKVQMDYLRDVARVLKPGGQFLISLYDNEASYLMTTVWWEQRRQAAEAAKANKQKDTIGTPEEQAEASRFETSMCTPMGFKNMTKVLDETGMRLLYHRGRGEQTMWVAGEKPADGND